MKTYSAVKKEIQKNANKERAASSEWFFKTEKGQYGAGDRFLGLTMPIQRQIAKQCLALSYSDVKKLLESKYHEHRMIGLLILVYRFERGDEAQRKQVFDFYIKNHRAVNNWDLVDCTTPNIVGRYLLTRPKRERAFLYTYARSENLWERRIAVLATYSFIREGSFEDILKISEILLRDKEDLIHKAVGWMLREVGKKDGKVLRAFLDKHIRELPRTTLRYAIEKFPEKERKVYLGK